MALVDVRHRAAGRRRSTPPGGSSRSTVDTGVGGRAVDADVRRDRHRPGHGGARGRDGRHGAPAVRHDARSTRRSACSSTCRSARSRRSSTSSPTWRSTSSGPRARCTTRRWRSTPSDADRTAPCTWPRRAAGDRRQALRQGRHPDPRRHRLHVGARPAPVHPPRVRRRRPARHQRLAPRPPRRPAVLTFRGTQEGPARRAHPRRPARSAPRRPTPRARRAPPARPRG